MVHRDSMPARFQASSSQHRVDSGAAYAGFFFIRREYSARYLASLNGPLPALPAARPVAGGDSIVLIPLPARPASIPSALGSTPFRPRASSTNNLYGREAFMHDAAYAVHLFSIRSRPCHPL